MSNDSFLTFFHEMRIYKERQTLSPECWKKNYLECVFFNRILTWWNWFNRHRQRTDRSLGQLHSWSTQKFFTYETRQQNNSKLCSRGFLMELRLVKSVTHRIKCAWVLEWFSVSGINREIGSISQWDVDNGLLKGIEKKKMWDLKNVKSCGNSLMEQLMFFLHNTSSEWAQTLLKSLFIFIT